jgi:hypothetical protein
VNLIEVVKAKSTYERMHYYTMEFTTVEAATWAYIGDLTPEEKDAQLFPSVRNAMRGLMRQSVRSVEKEVFGDGTGDEMFSPSDLGKLINETFALQDGTRVSWGKATVEQHRDRAEMLRGFAAGDLASAGHHEMVADMIEKAGVTCLEEITG